MNSWRTVGAVLAIILVIGAIVITWTETNGQTVTRTSTFTTTLQTKVTLTSTVNHNTTFTVLEGVQRTGNCTVTSYVLPDSLQLTTYTSTVVSGTVTRTLTETSVIEPTVISQVSTRYDTMILVNETGTFTIMSTSNQDFGASEMWTVTVCDFR